MIKISKEKGVGESTPEHKRKANLDEPQIKLGAERSDSILKLIRQIWEWIDSFQLILGTWEFEVKPPLVELKRMDKDIQG